MDFDPLSNIRRQKDSSQKAIEESKEKYKKIDKSNSGLVTSKQIVFYL